MAVTVEMAQDLPDGSVVATLSRVYVKIGPDAWLAPVNTRVHTTYLFDNEEIAEYGVVVAFDSTEQRRHIGDFFVPEFDSI